MWYQLAPNPLVGRYEVGTLPRASAWLTAEATSTEAECRQVSARFDTSLGPKDADGYSTVTSKGKKVRVRNVCLPDGTDPRGPKGGAR